jgi:hypothetical protein
MFIPFLVLTNILVAWIATWDATGGSKASPANEGTSDAPVACLPLTFGCGPGCVQDGDATTVLVRGPRYSSTKKKEFSLPAFYELVHVEVLAARGKHCHVAQSASGSEILQSHRAGQCLGPLPSFFVVNVQLPDGEPSMFDGAHVDCASLVFYFRVRAETQAALKEGTADEGLRLLRRYCEDAPRQRSLQEKLKAICQIENVAESGVSSMVQRYNGTPSLITKVGTLFTGDGYIEIDVDISACSYAYRSSLHAMRNRISSMELRVSLLVQGDREEELPERVWGCAALHRVRLDGPIQEPPTMSMPSRRVLLRDESDNK